MEQPTRDLAIANTMEKSTTSWWPPKFRWFSQISSIEGMEAEKILLETLGDMDFSDQQHISLKLISLTPPTELAAEQENPRTINTLIIDRDDISAPSIERNNVVICHGFGSGIGFFYRNLSHIGQLIPNSRIYAIDWLGMGRSGRPEFPMFRVDSNSDVKTAIDFFLDSFEEWRLKQHGLDKFVLVGHSMGGYLSALYALRHPNRVQKLILASPVGLPEQIEDGMTVTGRKLPLLVTRMWNANYTPQGLIRGLGPFGSRIASSYVNGKFSFLPQLDRQLLGRYFYHISADRPSGEYALAALLAPGAWAREPLHKRLPDLTMPCVFLYGQYDWMDRKHAEAASEKMKEAVIYSVENADHHLYINNPEEFNRIVAEECIKAFNKME